MFFFLTGCSENLVRDNAFVDSDVEECHTLFGYAEDWASQSQNEETLQGFEEALQCYQQVEDILGEGDALDRLGGLSGELGRNREAIEYYHQALVIWQELGDQAREAQTFYLIGFSYAVLNQEESALNYYEQALVIWEELGNHSDEGTVVYHMAVVYHREGLDEEALKYYRRALEIWQEDECLCREDLPLGGAGWIYYQRGDYEEALPYYHQALTFLGEIHPALAAATEVQDRSQEAKILNTIGNAYLRLGNYKDAQDFFQQALVAEIEVGNKSRKAMVLGNIGFTYLVMSGMSFWQAVLVLLEIMSPLGLIENRFLVFYCVFSLVGVVVLVRAVRRRILRRKS